MFFCKGTWKNTLYVHFKCILLHSRIFAVLVHWEISKKNGNWKQNVPNSCTVHRVFMILKSILICYSIQKHLYMQDHSRLREKSSQTKYQKNYPSKSKASFQYLYMRRVHEKILRVCFLTSLGDFGPQSLLISPNSQFFIKQHREVNNTTLSHSFIL